MAPQNIVEYLKNFGLSAPESTIYTVLLAGGEMTGYEIAKESGLSRSNVYGSLNGLVEKGAAYLIEGDPVRYQPVDIQRFCEHSLRELKRQADYLIEHAPKKVENAGGYITIRGSRHIRDTILDMLDSCEKRLYILAEKTIIKEYEDHLKQLIEKGRKVVIITDDYTLKGATIYRSVPDPHQIRFITDSAYVLTGDLQDKETDSCLYSREENLVSVMKEALKNRITLIKMEKEKH